MNILPAEKKIAAIAALCEGVSIRTTERLTGAHRDTIMRLGLKIGQGCAALHDRLMRNLNVAHCQLDEAWSYVAKKQRMVREGDGADVGDQYIFLAMDTSLKAILSYHVGKRDAENTLFFVDDLRARVINRPEISSDGFSAYAGAIDMAFAREVDYGQIVKHYAAENVVEASRRYSPPVLVAVEKAALIGAPKRITTSHIERQNLTLRMTNKRLARLSNGFSKKLVNHKAAIALYVAYYNLCWVQETLRMTPAMALGVADHIWTIGELVDAAEQGQAPQPEGKKVGPFRVIKGGLS